MSSTRLRWVILMGCFAATLAAIWYPVDEIVPTAVATKKMPIVPISAVENTSGKYTNKQFPSSEDDKLEDPFAPRSWKPEPMPVQAVVSNNTVVQAVVTPDLAPSLPQLPYRFLGKLLDGEDLIVYLGRGEQTVIARVGEVLEGTYKVLSINEKSMEFEHLPSSEKQILNIE